MYITSLTKLQKEQQMSKASFEEVDNLIQILTKGNSPSWFEEIKVTLFLLGWTHEEWSEEKHKRTWDSIYRLLDIDDK